MQTKISLLTCNKTKPKPLLSCIEQDWSDKSETEIGTRMFFTPPQELTEFALCCNLELVTPSRRWYWVRVFACAKLQRERINCT